MKTALKVVGGITFIVIEGFIIAGAIFGYGTAACLIDEYGVYDGLKQAVGILRHGYDDNTLYRIGNMYTIKEELEIVHNFIKHEA